MSLRNGQAPGSDLSRFELVEAPVPEPRDRFAQKPTQLGGRLGLGVVLGEVLVDQS
jgi:hypothetical protein